MCAKLCSSIGDLKEDIAEFANSWSVQTPGNTCAAIASDFPSPCSIHTESYEVSWLVCNFTYNDL